MQAQASPASSQPPACPAPASPASSVHPATQIKCLSAGSLLSVPIPAPGSPVSTGRKCNRTGHAAGEQQAVKVAASSLTLGQTMVPLVQEGREQRVLAGCWESCQVGSDDEPSASSPIYPSPSLKTPPSPFPSPSFAPPRCLMCGERITPLVNHSTFKIQGFAGGRCFPWEEYTPEKAPYVL